MELAAMLERANAMTAQIDRAKLEFAETRRLLEETQQKLKEVEGKVIRLSLPFTQRQK